MTRVLVSAASAVTRAGIEAILLREAGFTVVGGSGSAASSLAEEITEHEPDVVLLELPGKDDEHLLMALRAATSDLDDGARSSPSVVVLADDHDPAALVDLLRTGVRALLPRNASAAEILGAVSAASAGLVSMPPALLQYAVGGRDGPRMSAPASAGSEVQRTLTPRELEVLRMIADGLANKQIAARLAISEHTVKFHIGSVFGKMHVSTRAEAVMAGARRGLIVL